MAYIEENEGRMSRYGNMALGPEHYHLAFMIHVAE
jgi:hypothetical protein